MRPIHLVRSDKTRPAVILTRESAVPSMSRISIAPVTSTVRGIDTEVPLDAANGLDHPCVVSCDNITTIDKSLIGKHVGYLFEYQEAALARALVAAFDLHVEDLD